MEFPNLFAFFEKNLTNHCTECIIFTLGTLFNLFIEAGAVIGNILTSYLHSTLICSAEIVMPRVGLF